MGSCRYHGHRGNYLVSSLTFWVHFHRDEKSMNLPLLHCLFEPRWTRVFSRADLLLEFDLRQKRKWRELKVTAGLTQPIVRVVQPIPGLKSELETREVNRKNGASKCWRWPLGWVNGSSPFLLLHPPFLNWGENLPLGQSQIWGVNLGLGFQVFQCLKLLAISAPIDLKRSRCQSLSIKSSFISKCKMNAFCRRKLLENHSS